MAKWLIHGIDRSTGREVETILEAPDGPAVRAEADRRQILITRIDPDPEPPATAIANDGAPTLRYASHLTPPPRPALLQPPTPAAAAAAAAAAAPVDYATPRHGADVDPRVDAAYAARLFRRLARVCFIGAWWAVVADVLHYVIASFQAMGNNALSPADFFDSILNVPQHALLQLALILFVTAAVLRAATAITLTVTARRDEPTQGPPHA